MISLFAVITDFPFCKSSFMYSFPGSTPPKTSITKSIFSSLAISLKSSVIRFESKSLSLVESETKTLERFILITSLSRCSNREITAEPIFPAPKTATVYELFFIISKDKCYFDSNNN